MNTEFFTALELLEKEKGISKEYMLEKIEAALVAAYKKEALPLPENMQMVYTIMPYNNGKDFLPALTPL